MRPRLAVVITTLLLALALPAAAGAQTGGPAPQSERARTVAYWTAARIAHAIPRDFEKNSSGRLVPKAKPGGTHLRAPSRAPRGRATGSSRPSRAGSSSPWAASTTSAPAR